MMEESNLQKYSLLFGSLIDNLKATVSFPNSISQKPTEQKNNLSQIV